MSRNYYEVSQQIRQELQDVSATERSKQILEYVFGPENEWTEEILTKDGQTVTRLRTAVMDPRGDMGYVEKMHMLGFAKISDPDGDYFGAEVYYPHLRGQRLFYEYYPEEDRVKVELDGQQTLEPSQKDIRAFHWYVGELLWPANFGSQGLWLNSYPLQHPYFKN